MQFVVYFGVLSIVMRVVDLFDYVGGFAAGHVQCRGLGCGVLSCGGGGMLQDKRF